MIVACKAETETADLSFMVYNYSTEELGQVQVNGKGSTIVEAAERLGSVGGSGTACCAHLHCFAFRVSRCNPLNISAVEAVVTLNDSPCGCGFLFAIFANVFVFSRLGCHAVLAPWCIWRTRQAMELLFQCIRQEWLCFRLRLLLHRHI